MADQKLKRHSDLAINVIDDWPEDLPITEVELEFFESEMLDIITAMFQHG